MSLLSVPEEGHAKEASDRVIRRTGKARAANAQAADRARASDSWQRSSTWQLAAIGQRLCHGMLAMTWPRQRAAIGAAGSERAID